MTESSEPPPVDVFVRRIKHGDPTDLTGTVSSYYNVGTETRKELLRRLRSLAEEDARCVSPLAEAVAPFLTDEERSVRLTTAKCFVTLARQAPSAVVDEVEALADRVADDEEFYYVRARSAEALGYVALDHPEAVASPERLANLRIGLSFDEPEVKEKLAKALEYVALGDPDRLRHQVSSLAEHRDDENELVRYHLTTALVAVGCEHPSKLRVARDVLRDQLGDESPYVRGRAAEALGLLIRAGDDTAVDPDSIAPCEDDAAEFVASRVAFLRAEQGGATEETTTDSVGTLASIRKDTEAVVEAMTTPGGEECPRCGLELPGDDPPMCPCCGAPY
jgi:hypothetical protein